MKLDKYDDNLTVSELKKIVVQEKELEQQKEEQDVQALKYDFEPKTVDDMIDLYNYFYN